MQRGKIQTNSINYKFITMINCQVDVEFDQYGISGLHFDKSKGNDFSKFWAIATIVKLDSESLHFYFTKKSLGSYLVDKFFSDGCFLMKNDFLLSKQLHLSLRLPDSSIIPMGQYSCRDMGSKIAVQFNYAQLEESASDNPEEIFIDIEPHLKAA